MSNLVGVYISILVASNVLLMAIILYDKFVLSRKRVEKISQEILTTALTHVESQLQSSIDQFKNETKEVISQQHSVSDQTATSLQQDLKAFHTDELQKVQTFSQDLYNLLLETTEDIKKEMVIYIDQNKTKINEWRDNYIESIKSNSDHLLESSQQRIETLTRELAEKEVSLIVNDVLKNGISSKEQEQLVEEAITKYFGERKT
jgi:hypothetical protein